MHRFDSTVDFALQVEKHAQAGCHRKRREAGWVKPDVEVWRMFQC